MATSENKTAAADMVFAYIRRSPATRVVAPGRNEDAIRGAEMSVKRALTRVRKIRKMGLRSCRLNAR
jgi:hypothetical protein